MKIAPSSFFCCILYQILLLISIGNKKLANVFLRAIIRSNGFLIPAFFAPIPKLAPDIALVFIVASILDALFFLKKLFKKIIQTYMKKVEDQSLSLLLIKTNEKFLSRLHKAKNPKLHFKNLHIQCFYFCWQYKNYFKNVEAKSNKRVFFPVLFFWKKN